MITVHVTGPATSAETPACFLRLTAHAVGGGTFVEDPRGHVRASNLTYRLP